MHPVIAKTFGGLSPQYYFRQFVFGLIFPALFFFMSSIGTMPMNATMIVVLAVNTLLYPYSRFVYESIVNFIIGENLFAINALLLLMVKLMTMAICWGSAIFIAPVGLAYLYWHHSKEES